MVILSVLIAITKQNVVKVWLLKRRKIGIFAGAFDPIHDGHIEAAKKAVEYLELDELYFMVEKNPWSSKRPININHRRHMVDLAISEFATLSQLETKHVRFTLPDTLTEIEDLFPGSELYFVFGADVFINMNSVQWPELNSLLKHYIVVFERKEVSQKQITDHAKSLGIVCAILPNALLLHSSTAVRSKPHEKSIWLPQRVADYIDQNSLYSKDT